MPSASAAALRRLLPFLAALLSAFLIACAGPAERPPAAAPDPGPRVVGDFDLIARFSVSHGNERHGGRLFWRHRGDSDEIAIASPFGQQLAEISITPERTRIVAADGTNREAADAGSLVEELFGFPLPVGQLAAWLQPRAAPGADAAADAYGRLLRLRDAAWEIAYEYPETEDGVAPAAAERLPLRIDVSRAGGPELRLRIEEWQKP